MRRNGFGVSRDPIFKPLETIECRDAILNPDGTEATWPDAEVLIGNPPFLGGKLLRTVLGSEYVDRAMLAFHVMRYRP
jgi:type II restriction/modification system DNA methylase subunit YeeA